MHSTGLGAPDSPDRRLRVDISSDVVDGRQVADELGVLLPAGQRETTQSHCWGWCMAVREEERKRQEGGHSLWAASHGFEQHPHHLQVATLACHELGGPVPSSLATYL